MAKASDLCQSVNSLQIDTDPSSDLLLTPNPLLSTEVRLAYKEHLIERETERLVYDPNNQPLAGWNGLNPSKCDVAYGENSVEVYGPGFCIDTVYPHSEEKLEEMDGEFQDMKECPENVTEESLQTLAIKYKYLTGKWMIFVKMVDSDDLWQMLVHALFEERLPTVLSLTSTVRDSSEHNPYTAQDEVKKTAHYITKINVITADFTDLDDIRRTENDLRAAGVHYKMSYKPDIYTHFKILGKENPFVNVKRSTLVSKGVSVLKPEFKPEKKKKNRKGQN